ncbi:MULTISPECIES: ABC transporter permease [Halorussus]|uniref:ABC transporter permease n=1 Tax=Halorussus TaxID=1070314 RepID=UPI00209FEF00|nr:ABC transporter permease [Halorussus vallis]USZ74810.1 ABC transporter permease [Halorussus vallis]
MALWKHVTKRVLFAVFAVYLVISVTFAFVALTADPNVGLVAYQAGHSPEAQRANASERAEIVQNAISAYKEKRNLDEPVTERYLRWLVDITTLDWGRSYSQNAPVTAVLGRALPATLAYLVPAMVFALVGGVGLGVYAALNPGSAFERVASGGAYLGYGIPNYWLAKVALLFGLGAFGEGFFGEGTVSHVVLPAVILGVSLLAGQLRYARAESREYVNTEFLKLVRAKGASNWVVGRHVVKNAALPLLSLFFADLLGVLVVSVFILEHVFSIPGIGTVGLAAIEQRDVPLILGVTMVVAFAGIVGNLVQDLAYLAVDPRVGSE